IATNMAGRGVDIILGGTPYDEQLHEEVKSLGGLFVIGTERHEARRIDNQLRGRSGRQGDPGETQFYVSLEDDLMRIFGSGRIKSMMGRFGIPEDQPIQSGLISRALESAQQKIEGLNFDARKHTLEYDNVIAHQRSVVYGRRRALLLGDIPHVQSVYYELGEREALERLANEKSNLVGEVQFWDMVRRIILYTTDTLWIDHIDTMEHLRQSVGLRAYGQREPLVEYKKEALIRYRDMEFSLKEQVLVLVEGIGKQAKK
ncbi:MAG TPA: preprotein translocase subunit SecA, partial [Candidatus Paceibacterota bacterium]|nr:preprotein translocase subunit SecA [Candidatus Paceibacterota bacterium]